MRVCLSKTQLFIGAMSKVWRNMWFLWISCPFNPWRSLCFLLLRLVKLVSWRWMITSCVHILNTKLLFLSSVFDVKFIRVQADVVVQLIHAGASITGVINRCSSLTPPPIQALTEGMCHLPAINTLLLQVLSALCSDSPIHLTAIIIITCYGWIKMKARLEVGRCLKIVSL